MKISSEEIKYKICTGVVNISSIQDFLWFTKKYGRELELIEITKDQSRVFGIQGWNFVFWVIDKSNVIKNIESYCDNHEVYEGNNLIWENEL